jgi:hypothetical protein
MSGRENILGLHEKWTHPEAKRLLVCVEEALICNHLAGATKHTKRSPRAGRPRRSRPSASGPWKRKGREDSPKAHSDPIDTFFAPHASSNFIFQFPSVPTRPPLVLYCYLREKAVTNLRVACFCPRRMLWGPTPLCLVCLAQIVRLPRDVPSTT